MLSPIESSAQSDQETAELLSILSSLLKRGELLHQFAQRAVVRIAEDIVVKITRSDDVTELMNLQHISSLSQGIPIPKALGMLRITPYSYVFTSFISGVPLDRIWANITAQQKGAIREQLNEIFIKLRALRVPSVDGYYGSGDPPCCLDFRRWARKSGSPLVTEAQFNEFLLSEAHHGSSYAEYVRRCLPESHRIVMTHSDLHPRNLIVSDETEVKVTGIVDWEVGGGYPEYWEYVKALHTAFCGKDDDWHLYLPEAAIGRYLDEYSRDVLIGTMVS